MTGVLGKVQYRWVLANKIPGDNPVMEQHPNQGAVLVCQVTKNCVKKQFF